ncbi:hypothetical protein DFH06DRAFT_105765 [Mycena polygramma]|nr:hypothetical protein DFH06DRAFT_105765 [Mycena polygramma]
MKQRLLPFGHFHGLRSISVSVWGRRDWNRIVAYILAPLASAVANSHELEVVKVIRPFRKSDLSDPYSCVHHLFGKIGQRNTHPRIQNLTLHNDVLPLHVSDFVDAQYLKSLVSIDISFPRERTTAKDSSDAPSDAAVLGMLKKMQVAGIFPPHLCLGSPWRLGRAVFPYLLAHPNLQRLSINDPHIDPSQVHSDADTFYKHILPRHSSTLTHLSILAAPGSRWTFGPHCANDIARCTSLTELTLTVSCAWPPQKEPSEEQELAHEKNIHLLLRTAIRLPLLMTLGIRLTDRSIYHSDAPRRISRAAIEKYRGVHGGRTDLELRTDLSGYQADLCDGRVVFRMPTHLMWSPWKNFAGITV